MPDGADQAAASQAPVNFNISGARAAGYSDAEIADYLGKEADFNTAGARKAGYLDDEIISHLAVQPKPVEPPPPPPPTPEPSTMAGGVWKALEQAPTDIGGGLINAVGAVKASAGTAIQSAASNAEDFTRRQLGVFDQIDAHQAVPAMDDPWGYADASTEQRADIRKTLVGDLAAMPKPEDTGLGQVGGAIKAAGQSEMEAGAEVKKYGEDKFPLTDEEQKRSSVQIAKMGTGLLPYLVASLAGPEAVAALAGVQGAGSHYEAAKKTGASDEDAAKSALFGGASNAALMMVPIHQAVEVAATLPSALMKGQFLKAVGDVAKGAATMLGFSQLQTVADNVVAKSTYAPDQSVTQGVGENMGVQAAVGALLPFGAMGVRGAAGLARRALPERANVQPRPVAPDPAITGAQDLDTAIDAANRAASTTEAPPPIDLPPVDAGTPVDLGQTRGTPIDVRAETEALSTGDSRDLQQAALLKLFDNTGRGTVREKAADGSYQLRRTGTVEQAEDGGYQYRTTNAAGDKITHPIEVWQPSDTPEPDTISPDTANALRDHYGQAGLDVVFYKHDPAIAFDGVVDPNQPDTIFLSNSPGRNIAQVAAHELTHVLSTTALPDGTSLGELLNQQVAAGLTPAGSRHAAKMFGVTAPKRETFPEGDAGTKAHADAVTAHLVKEMGAEIGGEAPRFQSFLPRVVDAIQARFGDGVAKDVLTKLLDGLRAAMETIRGLYEETSTRSQNWVTNIGEIHDTLAKMYAERFGTPVEREQARLAEMRDRAERDRVVTPETPPEALPAVSGEPGTQQKLVAPEIPGASGDALTTARSLQIGDVIHDPSSGGSFTITQRLENPVTGKVTFGTQADTGRHGAFEDHQVASMLLPQPYYNAAGERLFEAPATIERGGAATPGRPGVGSGQEGHAAYGPDGKIIGMFRTAAEARAAGAASEPHEIPSEPHEIPTKPPQNSAEPAPDWAATRDATAARSLQLRRWLDELTAERDAQAANSPQVRLLTQTEAAILRPVGGDETKLLEGPKARLDAVRDQLDAAKHPAADTPAMAKVRDELGATAEARSKAPPSLGATPKEIWDNWRAMKPAGGTFTTDGTIVGGGGTYFWRDNKLYRSFPFTDKAPATFREATRAEEQDVWNAIEGSQIQITTHPPGGIGRRWSHDMPTRVDHQATGQPFPGTPAAERLRAAMLERERSTTAAPTPAPPTEHPGLIVTSLADGKTTHVQPPGTVPPDSPGWWSALTPVQRVELVKRAGVDPRAAMWSWDKMARDTRTALRQAGTDMARTPETQAAATPEPAAPEPNWLLTAFDENVPRRTEKSTDSLDDVLAGRLAPQPNRGTPNMGEGSGEGNGPGGAPGARPEQPPTERPPSQSLVPAPPPAHPEPVPVSPHARAAERDHALAERIARGLGEKMAEGIPPFSARELQSLAESYYGGTLASGAYSRDRLYDAIELGVNRFIQRNPERFNPTVDAARAETIAADLAALKESLPTQTVRAGEKDAYQQFSTPPDYAYAANWVANLRPTDHVLEPSAGVGGLIVHAMNAGVRETTVNELSDRRRGMIAALEPTRTTGEDAAQLHNILPADVRPTVVVMNPPFSRAAERMGGRMVLDEGAKHIEQALARLEPGGRLVAIVGDSMKPEGTAPEGTGRGGTGRAFTQWWNKIGSVYDVRANVGVDRDIYTKYGTSFPTRFLVIDKNPPSGRPMITGQARDAADLIERLQDVRNERSADEPVADQSGRPEMAAGGEGVAGPDGELHSPVGGVGAGEGDRGNTPADIGEPAGAPQSGISGGSTAGIGAAAGGAGNAVVPVQSQSGGGRAGRQPRSRVAAGDDAGRGRDGGSRDGVRPDGSGERDEPGLTPAPEAVLATENAVAGPDTHGVSEAVYENYTPQRVQIVGAKKHPGALVQSAAMATVMPPASDYKPRIPAALVKSGALSDAQLEAIVYAGHAHSDVMADGKRRGFFIGDGTGVGKGREIAGIILDNFQNGRTKAVWISEKRALINDAKRDWNGMGRPATDILDHGKLKPGDAIKADKGILFTSYDTLKSAEQTKTKDGKIRGKERVDQIIEWLGKDFDGVIAFDESHAMGNATDQRGTRGVKRAAQKALAGMRLQEELPNARVVYVSATGATEVSNLAYADRLGLWGEGTAFPTKDDFIGQVSSGGLAGMELVARDMKALGHYIARNLSYDGVDYDRVEHVLTPDQRVTYDKLAEGWQLVLQHFNAALMETGAVDDNGRTQNSRAKSDAMSAFWGGHQRFFNQIITSMQMPSVIRGVEADLKAGRQAVLQLVNTMEAAQERALEKARASGGGEIEDLDMTPRDQLMQMVEKSYPVQQMEEYVDDNGNLRSRPAVDSNGNAIVNRAAVAARDRLLDELGSLRVPDGPLEMLLNHFGTDKVAEVTGRKQRVVRKPDESGQMKTVVEPRGASANVADTNAFQRRKKPILVFSDAGGAGRSYHDDADIAKELGSSARRSHYMVQGGWRADKAMQGFGRDHRTNQASAPIFHLVTTDLQGQKRFISSIARRLGQLGALTKGERRAADQGMFGMRDNLESTEAKAGLTQFFRDVNAGAVEGVTMDDLEKSMGLKMRDENGALVSPLPEMAQFLNRVLSLTIDHQNRVFQAFSDRMDDAIARASAAGTLDTGVETYQADKISKINEQTVYTDPRSGAETKHVHLNAQNRNTPISFAETLAGRNKTNGAKPDAFVQNIRSGRVFAVTSASNYTNADGRIVAQVRLTSPIDYQFLDREKVDRDNWKRLTVEQARPLWDQQVAATPEFRNSALHIITGAVLPIWDRLGGNPKIFRLQTDQGERMLGRVVPVTQVDATLRSLGAEGVKITEGPAEIAQRVLGGSTARLANGWVIRQSRVAGEPRIELVGPDYQHAEELSRAGVFSERIAYRTRFFIPTESTAAAASIERITKSRPVTALEGGGPQFSPRPVLFSPRPVADVRGDELGGEDVSAGDRRMRGREALLAVMKQGPVENPQLGTIRFSGASVGRTLKYFDAAKLALIPHLREIIAAGEVVDTARSYKPDPNVKAYHNLAAPVRVGGADYTARVVIREDNNGRFYYDFDKSETPPVTRGVSPDRDQALTAPAGQEPPAREMGADQADVNLDLNRSDADKGPVQFSPRPAEDREEGRTPLFSALTRAVEGVKQEKATPGQWIATLKNMAGVKPEERAWTGLDDWLAKQPRSVTKADVLDYLREHQVDVREVVKGDNASLREIEPEIRALGITKPLHEVTGNDIHAAGGSFDLEDRFYDLTGRVGSGKGRGATKFGQYTLPGGSNYRELLMTLPPKQRTVEIGTAEPPGAEYGNKEFAANWEGRYLVKGVKDYPLLVDGQNVGSITEWPKTYNFNGEPGPPKWIVYTRDVQNARMDSLDAALALARERYNDPKDRGRQDVYRSSHWDEPNVLAHARFSERIAPDGAKVLHIEEVQSDWHQAGRREGYRGVPTNSIREIEAAQERMIQAVVERHPEIARYDGGMLESAAWSRMTPAETSEYDKLIKERGRLLDDQRSKAVPDAPFKTTWPMLAMKRMTQFAVDHGFDRVAWTPGDVQADRYSLAKQVDSIIAIRRPGDKYDLTVTETAGRRQHELNGLTEQQLADNVGKEMAERIAQQPDEMHRYAGDGLKVGGSGMKGFYDRQLPAEVQKLVGKFGAKVGQSDIAVPSRVSARITAYDGEWQVIGEDGTASSYETQAEAEAELARLNPADGRQPVHAFDITDKMRQAVQSDGLPLFSPRATVRNQREAERWTPEEAQAYDNVGRVKEVKTWRERFAEAVDDIGRRSVRAWLDPYIGIKADDPAGYVGLRNANTSGGALQMFLTDGTLKFDGSTYAMADRNGGIEHHLIRPLQGEADKFLWWVAANRAEKLTTEDRENRFSQGDIDTLKATNQGLVSFDYVLPNGQVTRSREAIYLDSLRKLDEFNRNVLDLSKQSGLIGEELVSELIANPFYVPFYRISENDGHFAGPNLTSGFVKQYAFKTLKGGREKLNNDLWDNSIKNWAHMIDASLRNRAAAAVLDVAETNGAATQMTQRQYDHLPQKEKDITPWIMNNGKKQYFQVDDPMLLTAISALHFKGMNDPFMKAAGKFTSTLTQGVTSSPAFMLRNFIRDSQQAIAVSPTSLNILGNIATGFKMGDLPRALDNLVRSVAAKETKRPRLSDEAANAIAGGATMSIGAGHDTGAREVNVRTILGPNQVPVETVLDSPARISAFWNWVATAAREYKKVGEEAENAQRFALYHNLRAEGAPHDYAAYQARDLTDFSLRGAGTIARYLTTMVPFLNARLQGLYKVGRSAFDQDRNVAVAVGQRVAASATKRVAIVMGATALMTLGLDALYADDEDYKKRTEYDRSNNWWFKVGDTQFRIPMGFEIAALSRIATNGVEAFFGWSEMGGRRFTNALLNILGANLSMNPTPQFVKPIVDVLQNQNFAGAPIVSMGLDRLQSEHQYTPNTTMPARWAGSAGAAVTRAIAGPQAQFLSPVQIDYLVNGYFGWLGSMVMNVADLTVRGADRAQAAARGVQPIEPGRPDVDLWNRATAGMISTEPTRQSRYIDMLYQQADAVNRVFATYHDKIAGGHIDEARDYYKLHKDEIARHQLIGAVTRQETALNQQIRRVGESRDLSAERKRIEIMRLNAMRNRAAENIFGARAP